MASRQSIRIVVIGIVSVWFSGCVAFKNISSFPPDGFQSAYGILHCPLAKVIGYHQFPKEQKTALNATQTYMYQAANSLIVIRFS